MFWFWFLTLLLVLAVFAWPTWPYTRGRWPYHRGGGWSYAPSLAAIVVFVLVLLLIWWGIAALTYPWVY